VIKTEIYCNVENGKVISNRKLLADTLATFSGRVSITIQKAKKVRSGQQNRYLHAAFTILSKQLINYTGDERYTAAMVKDIVKCKFLTVDMINESSGEVIGTRIKSTTELSTFEMNEFIENMIRWAAEQFNITIPYPNENLQLL
jgi:hypothetical protein